MVDLREILATSIVAFAIAGVAEGKTLEDGRTDDQHAYLRRELTSNRQRNVQAGFNVSWSQWVTHLVSRSVYGVLIFLITLCVAFTSFKNKYGGIERSELLGDDSESSLIDSRGKGWMDTLWKAAAGGASPIVLTSTTGSDDCFRNLLYRKSGDQESGVETRLKDKLRDAEAAVAILRQELDKSNEARIELENMLDSIDKDKETAEDKLLHQKFQGAMELENLKREIDSTRRKLQKALVERDQLSNEVTSLQRDARIVSSALRDNQLMDIRLDEARREIEQLKKQLADIQKEKEVAARIVDEIITKKQQRYELPILSKTASTTDNEDHNCPPTDENEVEGLCGSEPTLKADDSTEIQQTYDDEENEYYKLCSEDDVCGIVSEDQSERSLEYDWTSAGPVTGSTAFRNFLQTSFVPPQDA
ncbi:hypothetical protein AAG570_009433 [Ranatra chinensis]|uniref:Uncharacterized protein n=1 Tax=Ranatra chinensis TaxID=642074 RepID=A0ABD0Z222_9HEMI